MQVNRANQFNKNARKRKAATAPSSTTTSMVAYMTKKRVDQLITSREEVKRFISSVTLNPTCIQPSTVGIAGNLFVLTPSTSSFGGNIQQGVENYDRIGNKVKVRKLLLRLIAAPTGYNATSNPTPQPTIVRIWIIKSRLAPTSDVTIGDLKSSWIFRNGDIGLTGYVGDFLYSLVEEDWQVLRTIDIKLGFQINSGTGTSAANQSFANNDFHSFAERIVDLSGHLKQLVWNEDSITTNPKIQMLIQVVSASPGTLYPPDTVFPCVIQASTELHYVDS